MKRVSTIPIFSLLLICFGCTSNPERIYSSEDLNIYQITEQVYIHESFLQTESFGRVSCNGMIFTNQGEAVVFDTPPEKGATKELLDQITTLLKSKTIAVVPTHFHVDCLGGLDVVHEAGIPSYANQMTLDLTEQEGLPVPKEGFSEEKRLIIGNEEVIISYIGEGHTRDNIVGYISSQRTLFGGCLVKPLRGTKGYLDDANLDEWSNTVRKVKERFPNAEIVVPGHGNRGDQSLLDYTIDMFAY